MATSRARSVSGFSFALACAALVACSGDNGGSIPSRGSIVTSPPAATDPAPPSAATEMPTGGIALNVTLEGTGRITSQPAGIDCPGNCTATFVPGTHVTLVSAPAEGWKLATWKGGCSGATCAVVLSKDTSVTGSLALIDARWDPSVGAKDCEEAWGAAGEKLSPCDTVKDDYVVVHKSKRNVALCKTGKLVKNLRSGLGFAPAGTKVKDGDGKTPEGVFYVPRVLPDSSYYKAFLLSYPTPADAQRGVASGLITAAVRSQIESAHAACVEPPQDTALGGDVEIHGNGSSQDWTLGCIAVDDTSVDLLWSSIGAGDTIVVLP